MDKDIKSVKSKVAKKNSKGNGKLIFIVFFTLLVIVSVGVISLHLYSNYKLNAVLKSTIRSVRGNSELSYAKAEYTFWNKQLRIEDLTVVYGDSTVARFGTIYLPNIGLQENLLSNLSFTFENAQLNLSAPVFKMLGKRIEALGYNPLYFKGAMTLKYNSTYKNLTLNNFELNIKNLGILNIEFEIPNVENRYALLNNSFDRLRVNFINNGIVNEVIRSYANSRGYDLLQGKEVALYRLRALMSRYKPISNQYRQLTSLYDFIENSSEILFSSDVRTSLSLMDLFHIMNSKTYSGIVRSILNLPLIVITK